MNKFKIGDHVECVSGMAFGRHVVKGATAKVIKLHGNHNMSVTWEDTAIQDYSMREYPNHNGGHWDVNSWERAAPKIDWSKEITTRGGYPVNNVSERPYNKTVKADVTVRGRTLSLSYNEHGEFYPGFESPVDLVQT